MCNLGVTIAMGLLCWGELSAETAAVVQPEAKAHLSPVVWHSYGKWSIIYGYGSIPINTIFLGMNIHLPAILMFTRGTRFWHTVI